MVLVLVHTYGHTIMYSDTDTIIIMTHIFSYNRTLCDMNPHVELLARVQVSAMASFFAKEFPPNLGLRSFY